MEFKRDLVAAGELNMDLILSGVKSAPEFGHEIIADHYVECLGSSTAICTCAASALGLKTAFIGKLGNDRRGELVLRALQGYGVDTGLIEVSHEYQTGFTVSISSREDRAMVTYMGDTIDSLSAQDIVLERANAKHLHIGSYFLLDKLTRGIAGVFKRAHQMGMTTSIDAGWDESGRWAEALSGVLEHTDFFFLNELEARMISGIDDVRQAAREIAKSGATAIVKRGGRGALLCAADGHMIEVDPVRVERVIDTTGAGDNFNAAYLYAYLSGMSQSDCLQHANAAGAISVTREGGAVNCPCLSEIHAALERGQV